MSATCLHISRPCCSADTGSPEDFLEDYVFSGSLGNSWITHFVASAGVGHSFSGAASRALGDTALVWPWGTNSPLLSVGTAGPAAAGDGSGSWAMADAAELPPPGQVA